MNIIRMSDVAQEINAQSVERPYKRRAMEIRDGTSGKRDEQEVGHKQWTQ